jgi:hypothetical protein
MGDGCVLNGELIEALDAVRDLRRERDRNDEERRNVWSVARAALYRLGGLMYAIDALDDKPTHEGERAKDFWHEFAYSVAFLGGHDYVSMRAAGDRIADIARLAHRAEQAEVASLRAALKRTKRELETWEAAMDKDEWGGVAMRLTADAIAIANAALATGKERDK